MGSAPSATPRTRACCRERNTEGDPIDGYRARHHRGGAVPECAGDRTVGASQVTGRTMFQNTRIYEGTNQIQRIVIAKHLLR